MEYFLSNLWLRDIMACLEIKTENVTEWIAQMVTNQQVMMRNSFDSLQLLRNFVLYSEEAEQIKLYDQLVSLCMYIVQCSKLDDFKEVKASSNALTVLNQLNYSFSGVDLSWIKAPYAFLDSAVFDHANLTHADLSHSCMTRVNMKGCKMECADLTDVDLGIPYPDFIDKNMLKCVAMAPDNKSIVSCNLGKQIVVWDLESGQKTQIMEGHLEFIECMVITPDQKYIITGSEDKTIMVWEFSSGARLHTMRGHTREVATICLSNN